MIKINLHKSRARGIRAQLGMFLDLGFLNTETTWLAGGALRAATYNMMETCNEEIADYDMFFRDSLAAAKVEVELESLGGETIFKCPEGKLTTVRYNGMKIQLITEFFYDDMTHLINTFDINACRYATDGDIMVTRYSAIRDTLKHEISLHRIDFPVATMKRIVKYINKGYKLTSACATDFVSHIYLLGTNREPLDNRIYID